MSLFDEHGNELLRDSQIISFARNLEMHPDSCELNAISYNKEKHEFIIDYTQTFHGGSVVRYVDAYGRDYNTNISTEVIRESD